MNSEAMRWVSVDDQIPEFNVEVLVTDGKDVWLDGNYCHGFFLSDIIGETHGRITANISGGVFTSA